MNTSYTDVFILPAGAAGFNVGSGVDVSGVQLLEAVAYGERKCRNLCDATLNTKCVLLGGAL